MSKKNYLKVVNFLFLNNFRILAIILCRVTKLLRNRYRNLSTLLSLGSFVRHKFLLQCSQLYTCLSSHLSFISFSKRERCSSNKILTKSSLVQIRGMLKYDVGTSPLPSALTGRIIAVKTSLTPEKVTDPSLYFFEISS